MYILLLSRQISKYVVKRKTQIHGYLLIYKQDYFSDHFQIHRLL